MHLLVIRHALAGSSEEFASTGLDDSQRPLTPKGRRTMRMHAAALVSIVPVIDRIGSSPFTRAMQTAEIVATAYGTVQVEEVSALTPEQRPSALARWLKGQASESTVAIVGHEPHLGMLVSWLLSGSSASFVELKKGAAVLLEMEGAPTAGSARLLWLAPPRQLRALSRNKNARR